MNSRSVISWPAGSFPVALDPKRRRWGAAALVPTPPLHLRPKRGLQNYHVLWEADWTQMPPSDPLLLRRIGQADLWLVVCQWDLTAVEKAAWRPASGLKAMEMRVLLMRPEEPNERRIVELPRQPTYRDLAAALPPLLDCGRASAGRLSNVTRTRIIPGQLKPGSTLVSLVSRTGQQDLIALYLVG